MELISFLYILFGILIGSFIIWLFNKNKSQNSYQLGKTESNAELMVLNERISNLVNKNEKNEKIIIELKNEQENKLLIKENEINDSKEIITNLKSTISSLNTTIDKERKESDEKLALINEAQIKLVETFKALSSDALKSNNSEFLQLAKTSLESFQTNAKTDLENRHNAIQNLIEPLKKALEQFDNKIQQIEKDRNTTYGNLTQQIESLSNTHLRLQKETDNLVRALKTPQVKGRWGEITLKRVVEIAGMSDYCDFVEQQVIDTEDGKLKPDLIVKLPYEKTVIVDAKVPLSAYMDAYESNDDSVKIEKLIAHSKIVRDHMKKLSSKAYWAQFPSTPDFVVLFLPGESFFSAALEQDRTLIEDGISARVIIATPTTLIALLRTVAYSWQQQKITENSRAIWDAGKELFTRMITFITHIDGIGNGIKSSVNSFNSAMGSLQSRIIPSLRKLNDLGVSLPNSEIIDVQQIDSTLREIPKINE